MLICFKQYIIDLSAGRNYAIIADTIQAPWERLSTKNQPNLGNKTHSKCMMSDTVQLEGRVETFYRCKLPRNTADVFRRNIGRYGKNLSLRRLRISQSLNMRLSDVIISIYRSEYDPVTSKTKRKTEITFLTSDPPSIKFSVREKGQDADYTWECDQSLFRKLHEVFSGTNSLTRHT